MSDLPPPPGGGPLPPPPPPGPHGYGSPGEPVATGRSAGFWIRFGAALLDAIILAIPLNIIAAVVDSADDGTRVGFGLGVSPGASAALNVLNLVVGLLYYGLLEGGETGQTLGKRICGIRVVDQATWAPGIGTGRGIGRYFARYLSAIPCGLGYFWMLWDPEKQTWHDKIVRTRVVRV